MTLIIGAVMSFDERLLAMEQVAHRPKLAYDTRWGFE